jgi:AcrR family transcriptional regulator
MTTDGRATRWAGQHQRRRAEFVAAALAAIAEHGPDVSTERIAERAGVARTRLYKHFADAADLQRAIAHRVTELITTELEPVWDPKGTPRQIIATAVGTHLRWLTEHTHLYRYLVRYSMTGSAGDPTAFTDVKTAIGVQLTRLFTGYLAAFELDTRSAEITAFGLVGYVESATTRWLEHPDRVSAAELEQQLTDAILTLVEHAVRSRGAELDPDQPMPTH